MPSLSVSVGLVLMEGMTVLLQNWNVPEDVAAPLNGFLDEIQKRASWQNTKYSDDAIIAYWQRRLEKKGAKKGSSSEAGSLSEAVKDDAVNASNTAGESL